MLTILVALAVSAPALPISRPLATGTRGKANRAEPVVKGPYARPEANAQLIATAILHVHHNHGNTKDAQPWLYDPGPISKAELRALEPLMERAGFTNDDRLPTWPKPAFIAQFSGWRGRTPTRVSPSVHVLVATGEMDVYYESGAELLFERKGKRWTLNRSATKHYAGE